MFIVPDDAQYEGESVRVRAPKIPHCTCFHLNPDSGSLLGRGAAVVLTAKLVQHLTPSLVAAQPVDVCKRSQILVVFEMLFCYKNNKANQLGWNLCRARNLILSLYPLSYGTVGEKAANLAFYLTGWLATAADAGGQGNKSGVCSTHYLG